MTDWRQRAACRNADPEIFFTDTAEAKRKAKQICFGCPVRSDCYRDVMTFESDASEAPVTNLKRRHGVFAGITNYTRWAMTYPAAAADLRKRQTGQQRERRQRGASIDLPAMQSSR